MPESDHIWLHPTHHYRQEFPAGYRMQTQVHESIEIMYMEAGHCTFLTEKGEYTLGKGEFIYLERQCPHGKEVRGGDCRIINVEFRPESAAPQCANARRVVDLPELAPLLFSENGFLVLKDEDLTVAPLLKAIAEERNLNRWGSEQLVQLRLWELLIAVARLRHRREEESLGSRHVRRAKEYLAQHHNRPITIEEVAREIGVSRVHLQRIFHREVGIPPNDYLTQIRLQRAKTLLARTDLPLVEVALRVGLESQQYLHVLFRKHLGITPREYRLGKRTPSDVTNDDKPAVAKIQIRNTAPTPSATMESPITERSHQMPKVLMLGAGSGFTCSLAKDIMLIPGIESGSFALVDIDAERLQAAHGLVEKVIQLTGKNWTVTSSTDRRKVMADADYLISTIEVSGAATVGFDNDIPMKYGIDQCIGDTIGPGGVMKALRTVPSWIEILRDAEQFCPNALILNYTNPMSMMILAAVRVTKMPVVGLCHSVQGTSKQLAGYMGIPYEEMKWECGGINHMAWFTRLEHNGKDLYPLLRDKMQDPAIYERDPVRFEMMSQFGAFVTESSGHFSEYLPYFRKRKDLLEKYCRADYLGGSGFYAKNWPTWRENTTKHMNRLAAGEEQINLDRSHEYASAIIEAHFHDKPTVIHGSVKNSGLIENLDPEGVVEVPVLIDGTGYHPCRFGRLPAQLASLNRANMNVFELGVQACLTRDKEAAVHAMMVDPLSAAVCSPAEIRAMATELFEAEKDFLPFK